MKDFVTRNQHLAEAFDVLFESTLGMTYKVEFEYCQNTAEKYNLLYSIAHKIGGYNRFEAQKFMRMIHRIDDTIGRAYFNEGNPNNGTPVFNVEIGRESSVVCYITINYKYVDIDAFDFEEMLEGIAYEAEADEFSMESEQHSPFTNRRTYRIWWD